MVKIQVPTGHGGTTINTNNVWDKMNQLDTQLADISQYVRNFPRLAPETDDTGRLQRALNQASTNGGGYVKYAENLTFSSITVPSGVILQGDGFHALTTTTTTGNAIIIGNGTGVSYYTALDHVVISAPIITTGNGIYVTKAQHFALPYTRLIGNPSTLTGTGIYIDGANVGYNTQTNKAYISSFNVGINCINTSNAHTFFDTFIYNCNYGAIVQGSTGVRFIGCTFQSFLIMGIWFKAAVSGSQTTTNTVAFCYIEGLQNGTKIIAGIQIDANVTTTMLYGNHYSYLRPTYPEVIDNGVQTTRSEYSGASWNEPNKQGTLTRLPHLTEGSLPTPAFMTNASGSLAIGTSSGVADLIRVMLNDASGNPQWMKIPYIDNTGTLNLSGVSVTNTTFAPKPLVGTNVLANTPRFIGDTYVDTNLRLTYKAVGLTSADWKQTSN
jgi:hypothetical protein